MDKASILLSVKKMLGITEDYEQFDVDIIIHINSVLMVLNQLGVGPDEGFAITGPQEVWTDFMGDATDLEAVKSYVYMKVKMLFDPPMTSSMADAMNRLISELEWRICSHVDARSIQ